MRLDDPGALGRRAAKPQNQQIDHGNGHNASSLPKPQPGCQHWRCRHPIDSPVAQTEDTVTLRRADFEMMLESVEDAEDPVRIWREQRGLSLQLLARQADIARSYLVEIEGQKKPGSVAAYRRLAKAQSVAVDDLLPPEPTEPKD